MSEKKEKNRNSVFPFHKTKSIAEGWRGTLPHFLLEHTGVLFKFYLTEK